MHRLSHLKHHIIRNIDDVGDCVLTDQRQSALHPERRLPDLHIIDIMSDVSRADVLRLDRDVKAVLSDLRLRIVHGRLLQFLIEHCRNLSRKSQNALAIRPVRRDGDIKNPVVQSQNRLYIRAGLCVLRQNQQSVIVRAGIHIFADTELHAGTEHTLRLVAAQLSLLDCHGSLDSLVILCRHIDSRTNQCDGISAAHLYIVCAAAHLKAAVLTRIHLAYMQMGLRNRLTLLHQSDDNLADVFSCLCQFLYFKSTGKQLLLQLLRRNLYLYIFFQPTKRY